MLTSLAPSPIESVTFFGNLSLTIKTISAFCLGETLHARTTSDLSEDFKNNSLRTSSPSIITKDAPATIIACLLLPSNSLCGCET